MAITSTRPAAQPPAPPADGQRPRADVAVLGGVAVVALALALWAHAHHLGAAPELARGVVASLALFIVCGDALSYALVPPSWGPLVPLFSVPLGAMASGLVLTVLGIAYVPLAVSLWVTLAGGLLASVLVRKRWPDRRVAREPRKLAIWVATLFILLCVALLPAWRNGVDTIYGENPDAQQVVGIAQLFQHVPPTHTDYSTAINTVPPAWRFRYPIFYTLAGASNLSHNDPIRVFPAMAAVLMVVCALGFAVLAVKYLGAPEVTAPAIAAAIAISWVVLHLGWHPYWNQLWGLALFPYALLFGWRALADRDGRAAILFVLLLIMLELAYPLALPYPALLCVALLIAYWRRPRLPRAVRGHTWIAVLVGVLVLGPLVLAAAAKLDTALSQILSPHSALWGGDISTLTPVGWFVGTGGGVVPALAVLAVAGVCLWKLPRRVAIGFAVVLLLTFAVDVRFRTASANAGAYMDFKHLSFVGIFVLALAAAGAARLVGSRSRAMLAAGLVIVAAWTVAAVYRDKTESDLTGQQVSPELFQIRTWADQLPRGASVRVDIPASGTQLWAVYMLGGDHPVDAIDPVVSTTYAHAVQGFRAQYSLALRYRPSSNPRVKVPAAPGFFALNPPLFENDEFVIRRIVWPRRYDDFKQTASRRLVEP